MRGFLAVCTAKRMWRRLWMGRADEGFGVPSDGGAEVVERQVVVVRAEGVLDFLGDELDTDEHIEDGHDHRHRPPGEGADEAQRQGDDVHEDEFLHEHAVAVGDRGAHDALAGALDVDEGAEAVLEEAELLGVEGACLGQTR